MTDLAVRLGPLSLRSPLVAASGTVGSVVDWAGAGEPAAYGAAVAKSVSGEPWPGNPAPRLAPAGAGMLNAIGIQNPGIDAWVASVGPALARAGVPVWGSAVGRSAEEFAVVAKGLESAGVVAVEVNLSCPNLEGGAGAMFALDPDAAAAVIAAVRSAVTMPVGAKLSPNAADIAAVARAVANAGADFAVLTNTIWGMAVDAEARRPVLANHVGGYSGTPLKPIALQCVWEVSRSVPGLPVVGCGGVRAGRDVVEYLMAGAAAVAIGTAHFAEPRAGARILRELQEWCEQRGVARAAELTGAAHR